jgi:serine/threonine-protein kinase HipA
MQRAKIFYNNKLAGRLIKTNKNEYLFEYENDYQGAPISLTMPISQRYYEFKHFPSFFDGLLPEGPQLEALLRLAKLDRNDYFGQLITVGTDMVGAVSVEEEPT